MCTRVVCVHAYMGVCMGVVCVYVCVHPCGRRMDIWCLSQLISTLFIDFYYMCVCVRVHMLTRSFHMWQPEANSQESVLSLCCVGLREDWTWVIRLVGKYLHLCLQLIL